MIRFLMWPIWWLSVLATIATGAFWAHQATSPTWTHDVGPLAHVESAGTCVATSLVLVLAAAALEGFDGPRMCRRLAVAAAAVGLVLAARGVFLLTDVALNEDPGAFTDGFARPFAAPWTWLLVLAGISGWARVLHHNLTAPQPVTGAGRGARVTSHTSH